jgi:hypothetical protein
VADYARVLFLACQTDTSYDNEADVSACRSSAATPRPERVAELHYVTASLAASVTAATAVALFLRAKEAPPASLVNGHDKDPQCSAEYRIQAPGPG